MSPAPPSPQDDDNTNLTIDFGFGSGFTTGGPVAVGNLVWLDDGGGGGIAGDGVVNGAETGISAVEVQLFEGDSVVGQPFITTTTDAAGRYLFDRLPEGTYVIHIPGSEFIGNGPLAGLVSSIPQGSDTPDDDNADENGQNTVTDMLGTVGVSSTAIELRADTEPTNEAGVTGPPSRQDDDNTNTTVDFGFWPQVTSYSVGNRVWLDDGAGNLALFDNGVQDVGEVGIAGVTIALRAGSGSVLATTVTDEAGYYRFDGVPANSGYTIFLPPTNFASDGALHTFTVSSRGATDTASNRIDQHDNGIDDKQAEVNGISSAPFTVPLAGGVPIGEPDVTADGAGAHGPSGDANDNLVIDFGFVSCQNGPLVLPDLLFLGPEPPESLQGQTYTLPEGYEQLVVKKFGPSPIPADELRYHFAIEDSPYTTANREPRSPERVWACKGNGGDRYPNQCTLTAAFENRVPLDQIGFNAGNLQAGDVIDMIVIDDDDDTRTQSWVALDENGDIVTEIPQVGPQALVEQIRFEIPQLDPNEQARIATWAYNAVDSIGVVGICVR
ncbi:MAG: SdrD B-like domain-containing protein [Caldilineaceae bacterium]